MTRQPASNKPLRRSAVLFAGSVLILVGVLVAAEITLQILAIFGANPLDRQAGFDNNVEPGARPLSVVENTTNGVIPELDREFRVSRNSLGFRGPEPCAPDSASCDIRIVTIGGSTTRCRTADDDRMWASQVAAIISSRTGNPVWFNNAGVDGHSTRAHIKTLRNTLRATGADIAVFLVGVNDLGYYMPMRADVDPGSVKVSLAPGIGTGSLIIPLGISRLILAAQLNRQHTSECSLANLSPVAPADETEMMSLVAASLPDYRMRLVELGTTTTELGATPVFMTQPSVCGGGLDAETRLDLNRIPALTWTPVKKVLTRHGNVIEAMITGCKAMYGPRCDDFNRALELHNEVLRQVCREKGWILIDLAARMPKVVRNYLDAMHFSVEGNRKVAEIVADGLLNAGVVPQSRQDRQK